MDCFGFCGGKCSKTKRKSKEKYKEEVDKETNGVPVPLKKETKFPRSAVDVQEMETISESLLQASQETGYLFPHVVPSGVGDPASLEHNVNQVSDEMPNKSRIRQNDVKQTSQVTHDVKKMQKKNPPKPKHRRNRNNQESSESETDSSSDSTCDESPSADASNDSPVERTDRSKTKKTSRSTIISATGGIVDFGTKQHKQDISYLIWRTEGEKE